MKNSKIKNENHINIQGWMVNELKLKGAELIIYAIIYGFSQDGQSKFTGSLQYLADWTNSTKQNCINHLKFLLEKDLIEKEEIEINNNKYCKYNVKLDTIQNFCIGSQKNCIGIQNFCTNNIDYNIKDKTNIDKSILVDNVENEKSSKNDLILKENIKCIIDYLNESIGAKYKYNTKGTISCIKARFNEGYNLDDFYDVIDKKVKEWINTDMEKYLRPETLFGNKFENYLNQKVYFSGKPKTSYSAKPSFDNTANHNIKIYHITDEEFSKLTHEQKINTLLNDFSAVADMTPKQKEFYNEYCVVHDWEN